MAHKAGITAIIAELTPTKSAKQAAKSTNLGF
jgi:hypothetical protein